MRIKKITIAFIMIFTFLISCLSLGMEASAMEANPVDFSSFVNCYKGDVYTTPTYVTPLTKSQYYNVGTKCYAKYEEKTITGKPKIQNYGFKINGEFYTSSYLLNKNGTYLIETYPYEKVDGIIRPKGSVALETIYVTVDLDYDVTLKKTIYSYDAYDTTNAFLEAVQANFSENVVISSESTVLLKNTFTACKNNKEKRTIKIKGTFEKVEYIYDITIGPSTEASKGEFVDLSVASLNIKGIASRYNSSYRGGSLVDSLRALITESVNDDLNLSVEQSIYLEFLNDFTYKPLNSIDFETYSLEVKIQDSILSENWFIADIHILIYQQSYLTKDNLAVKLSSLEYLENQENINSYTTYIKFNYKDLEYYDYETKPTLTPYLDIANKKINYTISYGTVSDSRSEAITIVSSTATAKIITNYNYIVLPKKESLEYKNQVGVLVGSKMLKAFDTRDYYFRYEIEKENGDDYLKINLYETATNEELDSATVKIYYQNSNSENFFFKLLRDYGNFLKNIF